MTVYTAIFGDVDELKEPFIVTPGWRYICFTDADFTSDVWEIHKVPVMPCGPRKTARWYKINFHKCIVDQYSLWVDGSFFINCDLDNWWHQFKAPMTTVAHPFDKCIYADIRSCLRMGKDNPMVLTKQSDFYKQLGIKESQGLISSGVLMRENVKLVQDFCDLWWSQIEKWSARDQIGFGYANFMMPGVHHSIEWNYIRRHEFVHLPHMGKDWRWEQLQKIRKKYGTVSK